MARVTGNEKNPNVWRGIKHKVSTEAEQQGIYGKEHVNAFQAGAKRMHDPSTLYRSKYFQRTGKVPTHVPKDFVSEMGGYKKAARKANIATIGAIGAASNLAYYVHPAAGAASLMASRYAKARYLGGRRQNINDIMERETGKKQGKAILGGYYTRTVKGKRQRVKMPKS